MAHTDPDPHADRKTPPDHELTGMESFFDNLFNHHMVLPQPSEDLQPGEGGEEHDPTRGNPGAAPI